MYSFLNPLLKTVGLEGLQNLPLLKAEGFRDLRDLRFVGKLAVLPQDSRIFRIHILLNLEILFLEACRFQNSEGLEGLKEYALDTETENFKKY